MNAPAVLPDDVWHLVCEHLPPHDIVNGAWTCKDFAVVSRSESIWESKLLEAVERSVIGLAEPRGLDVSAETIARVRSAALKLAQSERPMDFSASAIFFCVVPHVATASVQILAGLAPELCLVSFAGRAYDTTDFVDLHPGGSHLMQQYHGTDATPIFDSLPHSQYAHDLMRDKMLRFDALAFVGRYGAPAAARHTLHKTWTFRGEAMDSFAELMNDATGILEWMKWPAALDTRSMLWTLTPLIGASGYLFSSWRS